MASDIALAVVGKIVETTVDPIVNTIVRQCSYIFCYKQNIETFREQLALLEARRDGLQLSIAEAERNLEIVDPTIKLWFTNVDVVKSKAIEVHEGTSNVDKGCLNGWCPNLKHRYLLSRKATKLTAGIGKLRGEGDKDAKFSHLAPPIGIISSKGPSISPEDDGFKGFATRIATMNEVIDALKDDRISLIGISGMGGVGKTTLVKQVLEKVKAESLFNEFAMTVVSQQPNLVKIQGEIAEMLGLKLTDGSNDARAKRLCERLKKGGRVLVVLDDIWEGTDLVKIGIPAGNGCKVVFTTRTGRACTEMAAQSHIKVEVLSDQEAWNLFLEAAGDCVESVELRDIAKEVAKQCGGLPIAIVTLGKTLSKRDKYEWEDTLLQLKKSSGMDERVKSSIMLSYNFLESRLPNAQPLLLLCSLFQEDENIPVDKLVKYSTGLDLFDDVETLEDTRNRVYTLVNYLKSFNLLLQGDKDSDLCVKLHDVVRDVCLLIASNPQHAYLVRHELKLKHWPQHNRKKVHTAIAIKSGAMDELPGGLDYPNLRLLQLQLECENVNIAGDIFWGMKGLEVFNFEGKIDMYGFDPRTKVILPPTLELLTNLQTLSLEFCDICGDLSSIGCLKGLKILSFFNSQLVEFPREVGQLKHLKLLDLRCKNRALSIECSMLSQLYQLEVLYVGEYLVSSIKELSSLSCLNTLQICVSNLMIVLELEESFFDKLIRFEVSIGYGGYACGKYGIIENRIIQQRDNISELSWLSPSKLRSLLKRTQYFHLSGCREETKSAFYNLEICVDSNFHQLEKLYLTYLFAMKHLWRGSVEPPFLGNLRLLEISFCDSLKSLFPANVARCLVQLEDLWIHRCYELKGVISNQGKEDDQRLEYIQFPKLKFISLKNLEEFKSFYPVSGIEDMDNECDMLWSLFNQWVSCPSLETMRIDNIKGLKRIVDHQMQDGTNNIQNSYIVGNPTMFKNLKEVSIRNCPAMEEVVFDMEGLEVGEEDSPFIFDKLASIDLRDLKKLAHVWRMVPDGVQCFQNLNTLKCFSCYKLRYLMSCSVAKMLVNLKVLFLISCSEVVGVIEGESEYSSEPKSDECIVFPQLRVVLLSDLKSLTSFCSSKYSFEFPLLDQVNIDFCPDMKIFCSGEVKAPVLEEPFECLKGEQWIWKGNINNGYYQGKREVEVDDDYDFDGDEDEDDDDVEHEAQGEGSDDSEDHDADNNHNNK